MTSAEKVWAGVTGRTVGLGHRLWTISSSLPAMAPCSARATSNGSASTVEKAQEVTLADAPDSNRTWSDPVSSSAAMDLTKKFSIMAVTSTGRSSPARARSR